MDDILPKSEGRAFRLLSVLFDKPEVMVTQCCEHYELVP